MNAGLDVGPNQTWCGAGSVRGPDVGEILTSLEVYVCACRVKNQRNPTTSEIKWDTFFIWPMRNNLTVPEQTVILKPPMREDAPG